MHIRALKHFLILAEQLHFARASEQANISTSALSRNIAQLEREVGVALFHRDNRSVQLTIEGRHFQQYARSATSEWTSVLNELAKNHKRLQGELSLYCSVTASYSLLFDLLNRFRPDYPGIEIKLHTGDPEYALNRVVEGKEDISIGAKPDSMPRGIEFKPLRESPLVFIAPAKDNRYISVRDRPDTNEEWSAVPMILSESGISRQRVDAWFKEKKIKPNVYAQVAGNEAIVSMVSLGLGFGVVPKIVLDNSPLSPRVKSVQVQPELAPYQLGLFTLKRQLNTPLISAFWSISP